MPNLTIRQAALFCGKDEKTVRRWITGKHPRVPKAVDTKGRYLVAQTDLERIMAEDAIVAPVFDEARLVALEQHIDALETRLAVLEAMLQSAPRTPRAAQIARETPTGSTLPPGYVLISDLLKAHRLESQRKAIIAEMERMGYLKKGDWKVNGHHVNNALDEQGLAKFMERYG